jgi:hypothetical protein
VLARFPVTDYLPSDCYEKVTGEYENQVMVRRTLSDDGSAIRHFLDPDMCRKFLRQLFLSDQWLSPQTRDQM